jgi:hypothetical protein
MIDKTFWDLLFLYLRFMLIKSQLFIKKNEILSFTGKWMELENIILREVNQAQKAKSLMVSLMWIIDLK